MHDRPGWNKSGTVRYYTQGLAVFPTTPPLRATSELTNASFQISWLRLFSLIIIIYNLRQLTTAPSVTSFAGGGNGVGVSTNALPNALTNARVAGRKRNTSIAGLDSSPGSIDDVDGQDGEDGAEERKRHPVKRACNECRQQKVSESYGWKWSCGRELPG
jgi:hypothetical protein